MKRFLVPVFILFLLACIPGQPVHAQTSPTPIPLPSNVRKVDTGGASNQLLDNSSSFFIEASPTGTTKNIPNVNLKAGKDFKVPKLEKIANFFAAGVQFLTPYSIKQKTVDQAQNLYVSGRARYCKTNANNIIVEQVSDDAYRTEIIPELSRLDQASRYAAAISSRYSISRVNGEYNYNTDREPLEIKDAPPCESEDKGDIQEAKTIKVTSGFNNPGGLLGILKSIFGTSGIIHATLASKQLTPYAESMDCLITGCSANGDLSYLKSADEQKRVKEGGGIVNTYAHITHKITTGNPNGQEQNTFSDDDTSNANLNTNTLGTNAIKNATNYMLCAILPKSQRAKYVAAGACQQEVTTTPATTCSTGSLPAFSVKSECKLKSTSINGYTLSTKLVETIEAAASSYNVPASLMLGIMFGEGAFNGNKVFSSAAVDQYLDGCTPLPNCSGTEKNIVPFTDWGDVADAVTIIDSTRKPSACNLTDGIFALAKSIHRYYYAPAFAGNSCFGIDLNATATNTTQSCSTWTKNDAESAIRYWEFGNQWDKTCKNCATGAGSCGTGGFTNIPTPTGTACLGGSWNMRCMSVSGGDTCDTIDNRTPSKSHNGCIWDVYKSH